MRDIFLNLRAIHEGNTECHLTDTDVELAGSIMIAVPMILGFIVGIIFLLI